MDGTVTIIAHTAEPDRIAASAARISTTAGDALSLFHAPQEREKNAVLVERVLASGHQTIVEHITFSMAFSNVSVYVEQFLIEFRLASFTVKSRRYVDYSGMGFVMPAFVEDSGAPVPDADALRERYLARMNALFQEYETFLQAGIPKEDARFLLPYSFRSNFYCTVNARELVHILHAMLYGRGSRNAEIRALGESLYHQANELCPFLFQAFRRPEQGTEDKASRMAALLAARAGTGSTGNAKDTHEQALSTGCPVNTEYPVTEIRCAEVELLSCTAQPEAVVTAAALMEYGGAVPGASGPPSTEQIRRLQQDPALVEEILSIVLSERRPRELEQIQFTFRLSGLSLAGLTHLTRHRMHSLLIPPLYPGAGHGRYLVPETVASNPELLCRYRTAFAETGVFAAELRARGLSVHELPYLLMSGCVLDVSTTMNGRELSAFTRLRTCCRAQWEIRAAAIAMLNLAREAAPGICGQFGPGCYSDGKCPEGRMTCGKSAEIRRRFAEKRVDL